MLNQHKDRRSQQQEEADNEAEKAISMGQVAQGAAAYDHNTERESTRAVRDPYHSLEFMVTWHFLQQLLPPTGLVLDAGGGLGRYALELCRAGYEVVLLHPSPRLVSLARETFAMEPYAVQRRLLGSAIGDVQDLSMLKGDHFDAVLCLGGLLTHIGSSTGRDKALSELVRVARPGALVAISVMGYLAMLRAILVLFSDDLLDPSLQALVSSGDTASATDTIRHFFRADELRQQAESAGLTTIQMVGCEGLSTGLAEATNALGQDAAKWAQWTQIVNRTCTEPAVVDMAEHILYLGRKAERRA